MGVCGVRAKSDFISFGLRAQAPSCYLKQRLLESRCIWEVLSLSQLSNCYLTYLSVSTPTEKALLSLVHSSFLADWPKAESPTGQRTVGRTVGGAPMGPHGGREGAESVSRPKADSLRTAAAPPAGRSTVRREGGSKRSGVPSFKVANFALLSLSRQTT